AVAIDLDDEAPDWSVVVPETEQPLDGATIVGDKLVLSYLRDAASFAQIRELDGTLAKTISLTGLGTASGFTGQPGDPETFYAYTSFNQPGAVYRLDLDTDESTVFA